MSKKIVLIVLLVLLLFPLLVIWNSKASAAKPDDMQAALDYLSGRTGNVLPVTKGNRPFTIAYVDIDPYPPSGEMLYYFVEQLKKNGWLTYEGELPFDPRDTDGKKLIAWLAGQDTGKYLKFTESQSYYLAVDGEEECRKRLQKAIDQKEIDLIFCLGTWPGSFVAELKNNTIPVMVYFSVDPVGGGLSESEEFSGQENMWCHVNYNVYSHQIQFYYENKPFQKIGMVYYDESVAAMNAYREAADRNGFTILEKKIDKLMGTDAAKTEAYYRQLEGICEELVTEGIDAFMLNTDVIKDVSRIRPLLQIFYKNKIPVFVQNGEYFVENGALMVVTASDAREQAPFITDVFARILNGEKPGSISQIFITPPYLSINLGVADEIGYQVEEAIILSAEKIYIQ